jgi:hypothetical protein
MVENEGWFRKESAFGVLLNECQLCDLIIFNIFNLFYSTKEYNFGLKLRS